MYGKMRILVQILYGFLWVCGDIGRRGLDFEVWSRACELRLKEYRHRIREKGCGHNKFNGLMERRSTSTFLIGRLNSILYSHSQPTYFFFLLLWFTSFWNSVIPQVGEDFLDLVILETRIEHFTSYIWEKKGQDWKLEFLVLVKQKKMCKY